MVINLITDTPETFEGFEVNTRMGFVEEYYSSEFKWSKKFSDDRGLLIYGGGTVYPGADQDDAPIIYNLTSRVKFEGTSAARTYRYDDEFTDRDKNYNEAYKGYPKVKLHAHYMHGNWDVWARYTQGGEYVPQCDYWGTIEGGLRPIDIRYGMGYRQATIVTEYEQKITDKFKIDYRFSYDQTHIETVPYTYVRELQYREDEYTGRILASWDIHKDHKLAFGGEWSHEEFGLDTIGHSETLNYQFGNVTEMPRWGTDMRSMIGEWQWTVNKYFTAFFSARYDDHTMVEGTLSPRVSVIFTPTDDDTFKLMISKASRTNVAQFLKKDEINKGINNSDFETLKAVELRYERQHNKHLWFAVSGYKHSHDMISVSTAKGTSRVGNFKSWGIEFEGKYKKDKFEAIFSHALAKLSSASLDDGIPNNEITASTNGYGDDFANWSNNLSKIHINYHIHPKWLLTSSLIIYWGYEGAEDYAKYLNRYEPRTKESFDGSYYLNAGLEYNHNDNLTFRADAYNILGWFDKKLGKRNYGFSLQAPQMVRLQPRSFGFQCIYKF
jgi:outer membrane receptor protein involved in Fe transport